MRKFISALPSRSGFFHMYDNQDKLLEPFYGMEKNIRGNSEKKDYFFSYKHDWISCPSFPIASARHLWQWRICLTYFPHSSCILRFISGVGGVISANLYCAISGMTLNVYTPISPTFLAISGI